MVWGRSTLMGSSGGGNGLGPVDIDGQFQGRGGLGAHFGGEHVVPVDVDGQFW